MSSREEYQKNLVDCEIQLADYTERLKNDPENGTYLQLKSDVEGLRQLLLEQLASMPEPEPEPEPSMPKEKWSMKDHPAYASKADKNNPTKESSEGSTKPITYQVGNKVLARWQEDRSFWAASIISSTGSTSKPQFVVKFDVDKSTQTISNLADLRPLQDSKKRKAESSNEGIAPPPPPPPSGPGVISAPANINQTLADQARQDPNKGIDGQNRPPKVSKKVKAAKLLEKGQNDWKNFSKSKIGAKTQKKDSQFRIGDSHTAKVGFTGSGKNMSIEPKRIKNNFEQAEDDY